MDQFFDAEYVSRYLQSSFTGFLVMFVLVAIAAFFTGTFLTGRRITFMVVLWSMFGSFIVVFYGLNFAMRAFWGMEAIMSSTAIDILSLCAGVAALVLVALYWKFNIQQGPTLMEKELAELTEDQMTPMDIRRREHMTRVKHRRTGPARSGRK